MIFLLPTLMLFGIMIVLWKKEHIIMSAVKTR